MDNFYQMYQSANFSIHTAGCLNVGTEWTSMVSTFEYVRIYYIRKGTAELNLTTGKLTLKEGYLYLIPAFSVLSGNCKSNMEHYFIHLVPDIFTEHFLSLLLLQRELVIPKEIAEYLFLNVILNHANDSAHAQIVTNNSIHLLISYFLESSDLHKNSNITKFVKVFDYIDKHINEQIRIEELANLMFMNKVYFSNLFKKMFGVSPQQYILQKKLDKARFLLTNDTLPIASIAETLGFYDVSAFTSFFKKNTGFAPKDFRNHFLSSLLN